MQFIGLRGLKAWVSLAQLAVTVAMSVLRGCLRMQRLSRRDNNLDDMPDTVAGHELDWLAFEIMRRHSGESLETTSWQVTGPSEDAIEVQGGNSSQSSVRSSSGTNMAGQAETEEQRVPATAASQSGSEAQPAAGCQPHLSWRLQDLLRIRQRLAHLTGHHVARTLQDTEYQR